MRSDGQRLEKLLRIRKVERDSNRQKLVVVESHHLECEKQMDELSDRIEKLAGEMQKSSRPGKIDPNALKQLDELNELLKKQHRDLTSQATDALSVLDECRDELERADRGVRTVERLKEIRDEDIRRQRERRKAA
jgi:flagellar export protein FliJ